MIYQKNNITKVGKKCFEAGLDAVLCFGKESMTTSNAINDLEINEHFNTKEELLKFLKDIVSPKDKILFKGSRGMRMETIIEGLVSDNAL